MIVYDKSEIRNTLTTDDIFELLQDWGGDPEYSSFGILSSTICHNHPGEGSKKLYYYNNTGLFKCYTDCDSSFDIFELVIKVLKIQNDIDYDLNEAVRWIANRFGIGGSVEEFQEDKIEDWKYLAIYNKIQDIEVNSKSIILQDYNQDILPRFNYNYLIQPWINEGISKEAIKLNIIGYYPGMDQITIPHFDINNRLVGIRGRTLVKDEEDVYGKYRPLKVNRKLYNHPLGMNLYNLNHSKDNICTMKKAIIFEGEKSSLLYKSYFGTDNDISVACCGSSISSYQIHLLLSLGVQEIVIAFDRQFQAIGDDEFKRLKIKLLRLKAKYEKYVNISFIFDKNMILGYKSSPIDEGKEKFIQLYKERLIL